MSAPFARIQTRRESSEKPIKSESQVTSTATLSMEANSEQTIDAYLGGLELYNDLFEWRLAEYPSKALDFIIDCFLPAESVPQSILKRGASLGTVRARVFQSGDWISRKQWLQLASGSCLNGGVDPVQLLADGRIFSLKPGKVDYYPIYGLDGRCGYQPFVGLSDVLAVLSSRMDEWSMAAWFQSQNSSLGGVAPKALLAFAPDRVLAAANKQPKRSRARAKSTP